MSTKLIALVIKEEEQASIIASSLGPLVETTATVPDKGLAVLDAIQKQAKEKNIELEQLAGVFRKPDGKLSIKQTKTNTKKGGGFGFVAGLIVGGPVLGLLGGIAASKLYDRKFKDGLNTNFIKKLASKLEPRESAILVMVSEEEYEATIAYLRTFETEIYETDMDKDAEDAAVAIATDEEIQQALASEIELN